MRLTILLLAAIIFSLSIAHGQVGVQTAAIQNLLILPHYAIGAEWQSVIKIINSSQTTQSVKVMFFGIHGMPQTVSLSGIGTVDNASRAIPANGTWELQPTTDAGLLIHGCVLIQRDSTEVVASVLFRSRVSGRPDFESAVPGILLGNKFGLSFDNTNGYSTGIALQNLDTLSNLLNVKIYDQNGVAISDRNFIGLLELSGNDRMVFSMTDKWAFTAGKKGIIIFDNFRPFVAMGLWFNPGGAFSTITAF
jgi:hypothetical protein